MRLIVFVLALFLGQVSFALEPDEILSDPLLEARARSISAELRCVVCQNEPIDSSDAGIARDMRLLVREKLLEGDSDDEIFAFMVERYGDYVRFRPPFNRRTLLLWIGPFLLLFLGVYIVYVQLFSSTKRVRNISPLTEEETETLKAKLKGFEP